MASLTPSILPQDPHTQIYIVGATLVLLIGVIFAVTSIPSKKTDDENLSTFSSYLRFFYASFLKPHSGDGTGNGQQDALESFYKAQAGVYDATRKRLLRGREDMLGLVAAQLVQKAAKDRTRDPKRIWVDVGVTLHQHYPANLGRLVAAPVGISRPCLNMSRFQNSSLVCTWSTSLHHFAKWRGNGSQDLDGPT